MARNGIRVTLAIEPTAHDMFVRSGGGNGKSSYISAVVQQRWRAWQHALSVLRGHQLSPKLIVDAMRAVAASWEFYDTKRCQADIKAATGLEADWEAVEAVCTLAGERAAGNEELEAALAAPAPRKKRSA